MNEMKMLEKAVEDIKKIGSVDKNDFHDSVVACFETEEEIIFTKSHNNGYDYVAYVNRPDSKNILMTVKETEDEIEILDVWIA